jgi:hypothetical protein
MRSDELIVSPHPFLEGMCEEHLRSLSDAAMRATFAEGECIFREGEPANRFTSSRKVVSLLCLGCRGTARS